MHALPAVILASIFLVVVQGLQCNTSYTWSYDWATNSNEQDPCQLMSTLYRSCAPHADPLQPLSYSLSGINFYQGPDASVQNICSCSYVMYNIMSACGDCQVGFLAPIAWPTYKDWANSCDTTNLGGIYPGAISADLVSTIPQWAQLSTKDTGDSRWSYGVSKGIATGHFLVNTKFITTTTSSLACSSNPSPALPIGTAFAGLLSGVLLSLAAFILQRRRRARIIPTPTRYHTAPDNTPLHPLVPRPAHAQGTSFLRRILEQENDPRRIEPYDISAAVASFPPHPAVFPPHREDTFPPVLSIGPSSGTPTRQPSLASLNPGAFAYSSHVPLRHSRSQPFGKPGSRPQTATSQFSVASGAAGPSSLMPLPTASLASEPPSPTPQHWPMAPQDPPAYRRKS